MASLIYEGHKRTVLKTEGQNQSVSLCSHAFSANYISIPEAKLFPKHVSQWFGCKTGQHYMRHIRSPCGKWYFPYRPLEIFLKLNRKLMYLREERKKTKPQAKNLPTSL